MGNADFWNGIIRQHADAQVGVSELVTHTPPNTYRGWEVTWDYGHYTATSPDYDASWEGEEDGWVDNGQRVTARTMDGLRAEVDAWFEDRLLEALRPFAAVAEHDIGDDESDGDRFRPITRNHAPLLTVGDLRRARAAFAAAQGMQLREDPRSGAEAEGLQPGPKDAP